MTRVQTILNSVMLAALGLPLHGQDEMDLLPPVNDLPDTNPIVGDPPPIADGPVGEEIFIEEQSAPYQSSHWFTSEVWDYGLEVGINGSEGNAQSLSLVASGNMKRETDSNTFSMDVTYGKTQAGGVETQHYALLNTRWDWKMTEKWFLFNKNTLEYDEFKAFDLRQSITGGIGYHFIKSDFTTLTGRFGAGASREFGGPDDEWKPEADFGLDFERKLTDRQKVVFSTDYYPTWEEFADYRLVTKASWEYLLDADTNLSLKVGAVDRYDSTPNGVKHNDIDYYLALLWKI